MDKLREEPTRLLAQAYAASALARETTRQYEDDQCTDPALRVLLITNKLVTRLLEDVLRDLLPKVRPADPAAEACPDLLM